MIPKIIHYCWFGRGKMPDMAIKCIESWKKNCADYEIVRWDEDSFDIHMNPYVEEAYESKKYAFVTDFVRLYALYNFGGIYMDTDVEVLKPLDCFLYEKAFSGFEDEKSIPTGIMAAEKKHPFFGILLDYYTDRHFIKKDGELDLTTNVTTITDFGLNNGLVLNNKKQSFCDFTLYPKDYFCPKNYKDGKIYLTNNTYTIHHFSGSWHSEDDKFHRKLVNKFGQKWGFRIFLLYSCIKEPKKIRKIIKERIK